MSAPRRPRRVVKPSASMCTTASKSSRVRVAIRPGAAQQREQLVFAPFLRGDLGDDLLRQHVERLVGNRQAIELAATHAVEQRRAFDQLVARQRKQPALRRAADRVAGAADALQEGRDRARRAELADEIDVADVDAELERGGRHQRLQLAALQPLLGVEPQLLGHAAVMRGDVRLRRGARTSCARDALGHAPRVDEDQRRAVRLDQLGEPIVDLLPDLVRHHRFERRARELRARDRARGDGRCRRWRTSEAAVRRRRRPGNARPSSIGFCVADRPMRCSGRRTSAASRSSDSARCAPRLLGATAWISSTITVRVVASIARPGLRAKQDVERFRRRHEDVRRAPAHARALGAAACRRCAPRCGSRHRASPLARSASRMPASGASRFLLDVVRQRLQRRDVDDLRLVRQRRRRAPGAPDASIAARNAASVLPDPVGAAISMWRPAWIAGQASRLRGRWARRSSRRTRRRPRDETGRRRPMAHEARPGASSRRFAL